MAGLCWARRTISLRCPERIWCRFVREKDRTIRGVDQEVAERTAFFPGDARIKAWSRAPVVSGHWTQRQVDAYVAACKERGIKRSTSSAISAPAFARRPCRRLRHGDRSNICKLLLVAYENLKNERPVAMSVGPDLHVVRASGDVVEIVHPI